MACNGTTGSTTAKSLDFELVFVVLAMMNQSHMAASLSGLFGKQPIRIRRMQFSPLTCVLSESLPGIASFMVRSLLSRMFSWMRLRMGQFVSSRSMERLWVTLERAFDQASILHAREVVAAKCWFDNHQFLLRFCT